MADYGGEGPAGGSVSSGDSSGDSSGVGAGRGVARMAVAARLGRNGAVGAYGERVAARHLAEAGLRILDRNWRCRAGELDLVADDAGVLVVCEVKTRRDADFEHPCEAVGPVKAARLRVLAEHWIAAHPGLVAPGADVRIDLVAVLPARRGPALVEHLKGAC